MDLNWLPPEFAQYATKDYHPHSIQPQAQPNLAYKIEYLVLYLPSQAHIQYTCQAATVGLNIELSTCQVLAKSATS